MAEQGELEKLFRVLSLDGGGAKDFYTLGALKEIEALVGGRLNERFDLVYGPSTGAIIAALVCLGYSVDEILKLYREHVVRVMARWLPGAKTAALQELSKDIFGEAGFGDVKTGIGTVCTRWICERPMIFKANVQQAFGRKGTFVPGFGVPIGDAVQASCSAFPFFKRKVVETSSGEKVELIDGGYCANNPTLFAIADATVAMNIPAGDVRVVSVGVGEYPAPKKHVLSVMRWAKYLFTVRLLQKSLEINNVWIHIPVGYYRTIFNEKLGWGYETEPEPHLDGRRIAWPRGKVLGGSSSINGLVYIRGQREDFDHWRQLGNPGWSYEDVLPYFKRAEDQERGPDAWHGVGGPLGVCDLNTKHELIEAYIRAGEEIGIPRNEDFNGASQEGVGYFQLTNRKGLRCSAAKAYLRPARRRPNLRIETHALVARITFEGRRATGVVFRQNGAERTVRARREIVLSAGAIGSPQIFQLSGVGPAEHLRAHGITPVHDLAGVGQNLQDHFQARSIYRCTKPITLNDLVKSPWRKALMGLEWALWRTGPLTIGAGQGCIFARTRPELATPDVQFHLILFSADRPGQPLHAYSGFTASVCQLRPESRGTIMIRSPDPADKPRIVANYLASETDRQCIVDGLKLSRRLAGTRALAPYIAEEIEPGPQALSDDDLLAHARARGGTIFHPTSTCMMGPVTNPQAVVDHELRVHGLEGLRVADASIMPTVVSGNTNAACIMIGEKCADLVLGRPALRAEDERLAAE